MTTDRDDHMIHALLALVLAHLTEGAFQIAWGVCAFLGFISWGVEAVKSFLRSEA